MITPEIPTGYTRESGYPKITRSDGVNTVTDRVYISFDSFDMSELERIELLYFNGLTVSDISAEPDPAQHIMYITIKYGGGSSASGMTSAQDGVDEWTLDDSGQEIPIDKRKTNGDPYFENYRTKHNYKLAAVDAAAAGSGSVDTIWGDNVKTTILSDARYRWVKEDDSLPDGWIVIKDKTKNIESVLCPSSVVVGTSRYSDYNAACGKRKKLGVKTTPGKTFGITGEWLVVGSSIHKDGKRWVVTTRYQNADTWDSDYYQNS
jgi:hypothetical protein